MFPTNLPRIVRVFPVVAFLIGASSVRAATPPPSTVYRGVMTVSHFDVSPPLRELAAMAEAPQPSEGPLERDVVRGGALGPQDVDPIVQGTLGTTAMPGTIANFNAFSNLCSCLPPSPSADVGPNHYVLMANLQMAIFNKAGTLLSGPFNNNVIWAGFGGNCQNQNAGQPIVLYDQAADRWILSQTTQSAPHSLCIAISTTGDPTGSYFRYSINLGTNIVDAPKYAVWSDAYYISTIEYNSSFVFQGMGVHAINRAQLIAGNPATQTISFLVPEPPTQPWATSGGFIPADLDGANPPPAGSPALYLGTMDNGGPFFAPQDALTLWRFHADFVTPANSSFTMAAPIPVSAFDSIFPCTGTRGCIPQPGTTTKLDHDSYQQRLLPRVAYRNFGSHQSVVASQAVEATAGISGMRWYEVRDPHGTPVVHQQGTFAPADGIQRWAGSAAMDHSGNIALGYSVSNASTTFPGIRYTGRLVGDPLGTLPQGEGVIVNGGGSQTSSSSRWGDYSWMSIDAADDCTFWYVGEYMATTTPSNWSMRVGSFKFPSCTSVGVEEGTPAPGRIELAVSSPSRGQVEIRYALGGGEQEPVRLEVFDITGRRVQTLVDESLGAGRYRVTWDGSSIGGETRRGGVYKVRLRAGTVTETRTVVLLN